MPRKFTCYKCRASVVVKRVEPGEEITCRHCGERLRVPEAAAAASEEELAKYLRPSDTAPAGGSSKGALGDFGASAADGVGGIAWLVLVVHIVAAIGIWVTVGSTDVLGGLYSSSRTVANGWGVALGIAVLLEGIFFCVVLRCLHWIGRNVADLRRGTGGIRPN